MLKKIIFLVLLLIPFALLISSTQKNTSKKIAGNKLQQSKMAGEKVFKKYCVTCHMADGGGVPRLNPPLIQTSYVLGDKEELIKIILNGFDKNVEIEGETFTNKMPQLKTILKDQQIADVLTYIRSSFGNKASAVTAAEVKAVRSKNK
ncbi:MAG TPA: cytochrome c [Hanamia sp.]|nr:cytochrome c [Hanamia sp.]